VTNAYGSDDFTVLTAILERAGGMPYQQLLEARITRPLGLASTRFDNARLDPPHIVLTMDELPNRVATYEWKNGKQQRYAFLYPHYTYAAGGLFSSITDMAAFVQAIVKGRPGRQETPR
jgi:CubicO group peptidase (beta-lactamase class C family)